jgi:hypothetical protein
VLGWAAEAGIDAMRIEVAAAAAAEMSLIMMQSF